MGVKDKKLGRKTAWELVIEPNRELLLDMYSRGATKEKLSLFLGISKQTFLASEAAHPEFAEALAKARIVALDEVRGALFKRAVGFKARRVNKRRIGDKTVEFIEEYDVFPDVSAGAMILKNAGEWSDNPVVDDAISQVLTNDEKRERACRILGIPNPGFDRSTEEDDA